MNDDFFEAQGAFFRTRDYYQILFIGGQITDRWKVVVTISAWKLG